MGWPQACPFDLSAYSTQPAFNHAQQGTQRMKWEQKHNRYWNYNFYFKLLIWIGIQQAQKLIRKAEQYVKRVLKMQPADSTQIFKYDYSLANTTLLNKLQLI